MYPGLHLHQGLQPRHSHRAAADRRAPQRQDGQLARNQPWYARALAPPFAPSSGITDCESCFGACAVANIICNYVTTSDWVSALEQAIPQRSGMRLTPGKDSRFKLRKAASDARHKVADAAREEEEQQQQQSTCTTSTSSTCSNSTMRPE